MSLPFLRSRFWSSALDAIGDLTFEGLRVEAAFPCNLVRNDAGMVLCVAIDANSSGICFVELHFGFAIELLDFLGEIIGLGGDLAQFHDCLSAAACLDGPLGAIGYVPGFGCG
tara:strand:+ start:21123 stop:21461 length:339 start_codon:yes stop_codon:yes gene_type:complete